MATYIGNHPHLLPTMVALAMAGWPCQPSNPPPKWYKPPILSKAQHQSQLQQQNINQKM